MNTIRPTATHTSLTLRPLFLLDYLFALPRNTSRAYIPVLYVFNKIDAITIEELEILDQMPNYVPISSQHEWNLEELMEEIWNRCSMLRVYTKPKGNIPDYDEPVILHAANPTIEEFCNRLHRSLMDEFAFAWVWGHSAKHQPQRCGKDHVLSDEDIVQIVKKV
jgi:ribosome-interacting GTPase 1